MANQTITTDTNHDTLTGRAAGENITIQQFATLTIDSEPQHTSMGLMGQFIITAGTVLIDARNVRHLDYTGASGTLTVGDTITGGTSGATGELLRDLTGTLKLRSVSGGPFQASESLSNGSGWTATASGADVVGNLQVLIEENVNPTGNRQSKWQTYGEWYELGTADGSSGFTINNWHTNNTPCVWVETGSGTGIYNRYLNIDTLAFTEVGNGVRGRFFKQTVGSSLITFGDGTNGNIPANGAKIRVPNLDLGGALLASPTVPSLPSNANDMPELIVGGIQYTIDKTSYGGVRLRSTSAFSVVVSNSSFVHTLQTTETPSTVTITNCGVGYVDSFTAETVALNLQDIPNGCTINGFSGVVNTTDVTTCTAVSNSTFTDLELHQLNQNATSDEFSILRCSTITISDVIMSGGRVNIADSSNVTINDLTFGNRTNPSDPSVNIDSVFCTDSSNVTLDGYDLLMSNYSSGFNILQAGGLSKTITVKNIGQYSSRLDMNGVNNAFNFNGQANDIVVARCYVDNHGNQGLLAVNTVQKVRVLNCAFEDGKELDIQALDVQVLGYRGPDDELGSNTSIETDFPNIFDQNFFSVFNSDTVGLVGIVFNEKVDRDTYTILDGTDEEIYFNSAGDLRLTAVDNEIEFEMASDVATNEFIIGHTAFANLDPYIRRSSTNPPTPSGNLEYTYDLDTGSGYSGTFKDLTGANLSSETITASQGFKMKVRIKCLIAGTSNGNLLNGIGIRTITTLAAQRDNVYDIRPTFATITAPNILVGSRVQLYNVTTSTEIDNRIITSAYSYKITTEATTGDELRFRAVYQTGTTAKKELQVLAGYQAADIEIIDTQEDEPIYATIGIDGSTVTEFIADFPNVDVDISDPDGETTKDRLIAWWFYNLMNTSQGIADWFGGIVLEDNANFRIVTSIVDLKLDNLNSTPVLFTDRKRLYRDNDTVVIESTSNSIQLDAGKAFAIETGVSGLTAVESENLAKTKDFAEQASRQTQQ